MTNTRKLAYIAILSAVSFLLLYFSFPLIPAADFLKVDFSILPVLIALVIFDFKSAIGVLLLRSLLKLLLNNGGPGSMIGLPMNFVALGVFVWGLSYFWKKNQTSKNYILGSVLGTILLTVAMVVLNYIYAVPLYAKFANFDIAQFIGLYKYLFAMVVPFNLLEGLIFSVAFALIYGGLVGNLIDRVVYGYVIDYLHFFIFDYSFPVFNFADTAIVIGFSLVIIAIIKGEENEVSSRRRSKWENR